jgi:hypothetical protein
MQYYRNPHEPIGLSLYRDHLNRIQRHKIAEFAVTMKARIQKDKKHTAPLTDRLLIEKFEREVDQLIERWAPDQREITLALLVQLLT